jgi:hypothetical protein
MTTKVNLSYLPLQVKRVIYKKITNDNPDYSTSIELVNFPEDERQKVKKSLENILSTEGFPDYLVAENTQDETELVILKDGDIEQLGVFICKHCSMAFKTEIEREIHQRIHYFI